MYLHFAPMKLFPERQQPEIACASTPHRPAIGCDSLGSTPPKSQPASTYRNSSQAISVRTLLFQFCTSVSLLQPNLGKPHPAPSGGKRRQGICVESAGIAAIPPQGEVPRGWHPQGLAAFFVIFSTGNVFSETTFLLSREPGYERHKAGLRTHTPRFGHFSRFGV